MTTITPNADPVYSFEGAYELGIIDGNLTIQETVGGTDEGDVYSLTISEAGKYNFNLDGLSADADLALLDSTGEVIDFPQIDGSVSETIAVDLAEGDYYVAVITYDGAETSYTLDISPDDVLEPPDGNVIVPTIDPGDSLDTAFDLGLLFETITVEESLAATTGDDLDLYEFTVDTAGEYSFNLDGLSANADLVLFNSADVDANGEVTAIANANESTGIGAESIVTDLDAGEYYVGVLTPDNVTTEYTLSAGNGTTVNEDSGVEIITPPVDPGITIETAFDLGVVTGTVSVDESVGTVGVAEDTGDLYTFTVDEASEFTLSLDGLSANADLYLFSAESGDIVGSSEATGTEAETLAGELAPGTYYAAVFPDEDVATDYVFTISDGTTNIVEEDPVGEDPTAVDPGNTFDTALELGEYSGSVSTTWSDTIGGEDTVDVFQFTISQTQQFEAVLSNLEADVDLGLFDANEELVISSETPGNVDESFGTTIEAGDYFVGVVSFDGVETAYDLDIAFGTVGTSILSTEIDPIGTSTEDYSLV